MIAWLAILACILPPSVFAAFPPRTLRWRRARSLYWISMPLAIAWFAVNLVVLDPAGPAFAYYGSWLGFVIVAAVWAYAGGTIRGEWSQWREQRREQAQTSHPDGPPAGSGVGDQAKKDPAKPWKK